MKRILVGCPVMDTYEECIERWLSAVQAFNWGRIEVMLVDTGESIDFCNRWHGVVNVWCLGLGRESPFRRVALGMEFLRQFALDGGYDYLLCVEIDVVAPPNTPFVLHMLSSGGDFDYVSHTYPTRNGPGAMLGFGCVIFKKRFLERIRFDESSPYVYPDTWLWEFVVSRTNEFRAAKVHGYLDISHKDCGLIR
jgi:hypothetical protein